MNHDESQIKDADLKHYGENCWINRLHGTFRQVITILFSEKMDYNIEHGRPEDIGGRLDKEIRTYELLDSLGIEYDRIDHEALMTIEACHGVDAAFGTEVCKNLMLCNRQETAFYLLMLPGSKKFDTKEVSKQLGTARLSFAKAEYMERFLDITPGSLSVMGLMNDTENHVQLLIDEELLEDEYFGCHPCINTSSLRIRTKDLTDKILPAVHHEPITVKLNAG